MSTPADNTPVFDVKQENSGKYTAVLVDENGDAISYEILDSLTLTLYDAKTGAIINSRDTQDVLNTNGVTLDCAGNLTWQWSPLDMPKIYDKNPETHIALWKAVWNGGDSQILYDIAFRVYKVSLPS